MQHRERAPITVACDIMIAEDHERFKNPQHLRAGTMGAGQIGAEIKRTIETKDKEPFPSSNAG